MPIDIPTQAREPFAHDFSSLARFRCLTTATEPSAACSHFHVARHSYQMGSSPRSLRRLSPEISLTTAISKEHRSEGLSARFRLSILITTVRSLPNHKVCSD